MGGEFNKGDRVITPRDEVGWVQLQDDQGFVHGEYAEALSAENAWFTLKATVLVHWKPNMPRPKPYRAPLVATTAKGAQR